MKRFSGIAFALSVLAFGFGANRAPAGAAPSDPQACGLRPPTAAEQARDAASLVRTTRVRLNRLGLDRVNEHRRKKGLRTLSEQDVPVAPLGAEAVGGDGAGEAVAAGTPSYVDNSSLKYFPPIRSQGSLGSCAQFSAVYYTLTHMTAMARDWDAKNGGDAYRFSPKWTYNMVNGGSDSGSWMTSAYYIAQKHGLATWAEFPYDGNYRAWCLDPAVWRHAIDFRADQTGSVGALDTDLGLQNLKALLANGYVLNYATYISNWVFTTTGNDPSTSADDAFAGKSACGYVASGSAGPHGMTVVGYNDDIWVDINGNKQVDAGEKGALRIANSWGYWRDAGFTWLSYDALKSASAVAGAPSSRQAAFWSKTAYWVTARSSYQPRLLGQFTLNHASRNELTLGLGVGAPTATTPATSWTPTMITAQGGAYAFDGTTVACDGSFVFDFSDLVPAAPAEKRYFLKIQDSGASNPATVKAFKLIDPAGGEVACLDVPKTLAGKTDYVWANYTVDSAAVPPVAAISASPMSGSAPLAVSFDGSASYDPDGSIVSYAWDFGDGATATTAAATTSHAYTSGGTFQARLTVTDNSGRTAASPPATITVIGPPETTATVSVSTADDDYKENSTGTLSKSAGEHFLWTATYSKQAYRFQNVPVPKGATVLEARLEMFAFGDAYVGRALKGTARAESSGNAPAYAGAAYEITNAPKTAASVAIENLPAWTANAHNKVADVASVIQEIVDRPDWASGNALKIFLLDNGSADYRKVKTFNSSAAQAARLVLRWSTAAPNVPPTAAVSANPTTGTTPLAVSFDGRGSSDPDGSIVSYAWDFGDGTVATGERVSHTYQAAGAYTARLTVTDDAGATGSASVVIQAGGSLKEITVSISSGDDDYKENSTGSMAKSASEHDPWTTAYQKQAYRFANVALPKGAIIEEARLEMYAFGASYVARAIKGTARGEASGNAPAYSGAAFEITNAPKTAASVAIENLPAWTADVHNKVADVAPVVQEIVNRADWASGNALKILLLDNGSTDCRKVRTYNNSPAQAARLVIRYR